MFWIRSGGLDGLGGRIGRTFLMIASDYFRPSFNGGLCDKVLPAADFDALDVRPSRSTALAADAAFADETFFGALVCDKALPLDVLVFALVEEDFRVDEAARAGPFPVTFDFDMAGLLVKI
jgi:hypothetical protein